MKLNFHVGTANTSEAIFTANNSTVGILLSNNSRTFPDRVAIEYQNGYLTYYQLNIRACRLGNALLSMGVIRGDRVAVLSENRIEYCEIAYAAAKIGAILPCLNWRLSADELRHCIRLTSPGTILISSRHRSKFEEIRNDLPFINRVILLDEKPETDDQITYDSLFNNANDSEPSVMVFPEDGYIILFTSGTTGYPKAAIISHRAVFGRAWTWVADLKMSDKDTFIGWPPMFHMASMDHMLLVNIIGGKFICLPGYDPEAIAHYVWKERLGWLLLMPGTYEPLFELLTKSNKKVVGMKYVGAMADLTPPSIIAEITRLVKAPFLNTFGSTETGLAPGTNSVIPVGEPPRRFSKRINTTCQVRLVDSQDQDVPLGQPGEIAFRGLSVCSGYWLNEEANSEDFRNGWFHMGDVFAMNPDKTIDFIDRRKYIIKSGGENIYPAEIERVLMSHPSVQEAVVVRLSDPKWGETPKAYVATRSKIDENELLDLCKKHLAGYKKPRYIEFIPFEKFPRSTTGKVQRHEMEKWQEGHKQE